MAKARNWVVLYSDGWIQR